MSQDDTGEKQERRQFFISYTGRDKPWAEWIAAQLDAAGYTFFFQAWDFRPGSNFVIEMDQAAKWADRTLLVLSAAYQQSGFARSEWAAAFRQDPTGRERRLLPVRIEACALDGLLAQIGYIDLVDSDAEQAKERLLKGIQTGRVRPTHVPFPGQQVAAVAFPGAFPAQWHIPFARNPFFTGREELLEQLHTQLSRTMAAVALSQPQAISGLGGIGKTQLAIEYAYRYRSDYQAVLWVRAETTEALNASYSELATLLKLPEKDAQEQEVVVQSVKQWLRQTHGWLLILDNADDLNLVRAFVPTGAPGHLILTTRAQITGKVAKCLDVDTLESNVGALFLLRRAGRLPANASLDAASDADQAMARALTREMGGLPLALDQAGAYIEETGCSLANYQQQYQIRRAELLAHRGMLVDDHPEPVATTWSLSFQKVEQANPIAAELLRICAFLAPDAIPEELLVEALKTPLPSSEASESEDDGGEGFSPLISEKRKKSEPILPVERNGAIDEAVTFLRVYSLVQRNTTEKMLSVHRLVQAVLRESLHPITQQQWMQRVVLAVNVAFPFNNFEDWPICERLLPHALVCANWIEQAQIMTGEAARLLNQAGSYLNEHGRYAGVEGLQKLALAINEQQFGSEHTKTAGSLTHLGCFYKNQGKYAEAEQLFVRALAIDTKVYGAGHPDVATDLNNLAVVYRDQGKYAEAEPLYVRALAIREQELGASHPYTANSLNNQAVLYRDQGKYAEAEPLLMRALAIREQELGASHPYTASSLNSLAALYESRGKYAEAEPLYVRALAILEDILGRNHPSTQTVRANYARLLRKMEY